jgi:four helix bundle protein
MLDQLTIFEKTYELILWLYPAVRKFPKAQRFVLGQQIENTALDILRGIIRANAEREKLPYLKRISVDLDTLRILLRLSKDLELISVRQYRFSAEKVNEVGKLLGGWMRSAAH